MANPSPPAVKTKVAHCVYCPNPGSTDEHIIPQGLGGVDFLLHGSCKVCQKIINEEVEWPFADYCQDVRYLHKLGRRRRSTRLTAAPTKVHHDPDAFREGENPNDAEGWQEVTLPYAERLNAVTLPYLNWPGMYLGRSPTESTADPVIDYWWYSNKSPDEIPAEGAPAVIYSEDTFALAILYRQLAKIAHCAAVQKYGLGGFTPFLVDIVLGRDLSKATYYIGGYPHPGGVGQTWAPSETPFEIGTHVQPVPFVGYPHVTCQIRLLADLFNHQGATSPVYFVIAGRVAPSVSINYPQLIITA
jgi:hypothetical protein